MLDHGFNMAAVIFVSSLNALSLFHFFNLKLRRLDDTLNCFGNTFASQNKKRVQSFAFLCCSSLDCCMVTSLTLISKIMPKTWILQVKPPELLKKVSSALVLSWEHLSAPLTLCPLNVLCTYIKF